MQRTCQLAPEVPTQPLGASGGPIPRENAFEDKNGLNRPVSEPLPTAGNVKS